MISIIIPIYNGEKFLEKCIESALNQSYQDIEIVLVDDNSSDNSLEIEERYANAYFAKIKLIALKENKGVCNAWNIGIKEAKGEYVILLAHDDWLDECLCERMHQIAQEYQSDIVIAPKRGWVDERNFVYRDVPKCYLGEMTIKKRKAAFVHLANDVGFVFDGMINKKFFDTYIKRFPQITPDDIPVTPFYFVYANHIGIAEGCYYNYRIHNSSTAHQKNSTFYLNIHKAALLMREKFIKENLYGLYKEEVDFAFILSFYYYTIFNCLARYDRRPLELMHKMKNDMEKILPNYSDNYYIPLFWKHWKYELLRGNDISPEMMEEQFPDCDTFLEMSHDGRLEDVFGEWKTEEYVSGLRKEKLYELGQLLREKNCPKKQFFRLGGRAEGALEAAILKLLNLQYAEKHDSRDEVIVVLQEDDYVRNYVAEKENRWLLEITSYLKSKMQLEEYLGLIKKY